LIVKSYSLSHLSDHTLLRDLAALITRDRATTAELLAHIAEVDARKLYLPAAYPSMFAYCVGELRLSEDAAFKRITAARVARRFPAIFDALAQGRLHLSAVVLLAPHLTEHTVDELLAAATHRTRTEIERLLAERFPRPDLLAWVAAIPGSVGGPSAEPQAPEHCDNQLAPGRVEEDASQAPGPDEERLSPGRVPTQHAPGRVGDRSRVTPLAPERFAVQCTISQGTHGKLRYAQALLSHEFPSGDIAEVLDRALDALIPQLERRKFAATARPRHARPRSAASPRYIPAEVKRTVWERDQGRCTFVSENGRRCPALTRLEFDHIDPVARGGKAEVTGIRLRCRAHNQYAAECTFGTEFMRRKRLAAAEARAAANGQPATETRSAAKAHASVRVGEQAVAKVHEREQAASAAQVQEREQAVSAAEARAIERAAEEARAAAAEQDVVPWLRALGFSAAEARRAAALCEDMPDASLEERVRRALTFFHVRGTKVIRAVEDRETVVRTHEAGVPASV
jgi:hypothetical protein